MTVSRVINNNGQVAAKTRERIERAMKELDYVVNYSAKNLVTNKTWSIGIIVPDITNPFFASLVKAGEKICTDRGYTLMIGNTDGNIEIERRLINTYKARMCEAIIMVAPRIGDSELIDLNAQIPLIVVDRNVQDEDVLQVYLDNTKGAQVATNHLLELGHRRIGFIMGPDSVPNSYTRRDGYINALSEYDIAFDPELVFHGDFVVETGRAALDYYESLKEKPTAIFCSNDLIAMGILSRAHELEIEIPENYSIVGFDNIFLSSMVNPPLTTVSYPFVEMGVEAIILLLDSLPTDTKVQVNENLDHKLIIRKSTRSINGNGSKV